MRKFFLFLSAALVAPIVTPFTTTPASAQSNIDGRVGKLESEMRAVQRKVFPGGTPTVEPQITAPAAPETEIGTPATAPIADLTQRVSSLEQQMATMTGQIEQAQYRLRQLEDQFANYKKDVDARIGAGGTGGPAVSPTVSGAPADSAAAASAASPAVPPPPRKAEAEVKAPPPPDKVGGIEKPSTGQADEDDYIYGYRLYSAKRYPEAIAQLKKVVADYPKSRRASFAQNLVGRAYLDDGKPNLAATNFYENYKKMPDGERAPDSLFYLGQSLVKLNKPADACKVYGELTDVYAGKISTQMQADIARARTTAKCK